MKFSSAMLALVAGANAHTLLSEIYIDGKAQGDGTCVRTPKDAVGAVDPITDLSSTDMACGKDGETGVARVCPISGGSSLTFEYRQWPDDASKGSLAEGHMGSCSVYLKKVGSAANDTASGDGWFKLWDDGYDESSGKWCTQKMIGNNGRITVVIPDSLQGGDYLVRPELLALHNVYKGTPEFYVGCAQLFLESSGSSGPESTVSIPGYISKTSDSVTFDVWEKPMALPYPLPGPDVYKSVSSNSILTSQKQTDGKPVDGCILTNANWCGVELPDFSDEDGCWDADKDCWAQLDECYDSAPPTGSANCKIWEQKCKSNQDTCNSGSPSGPANKGKVLTPDATTISVPAAVNGGISYGGSSDSAPSDDSSSDAASSSSAAAPAYSAAAKQAEPNKDASSAPASSAAPQSSAAPETYAADPVPVASSAPTTTLATQVSSAAPNVVTNVVYETEWAQETITTNVYVTATDTPRGYNKLHRAHFRHGHH